MLFVIAAVASFSRIPMLMKRGMYAHFPLGSIMHRYLACQLVDVVLRW